MDSPFKKQAGEWFERGRHDIETAQLLYTNIVFLYHCEKHLDTRGHLKASDYGRGQGVPQIQNGAYTTVREYFNLRDNTAIGR